MPTLTIACPECRRPLNLPPEASNRTVQCPACRGVFHPAGADQFVPPKAALPSRAPTPAVAPPVPTPTAAPPTPEYDPRRSKRRREEYDICPNCNARFDRGRDRCPECDAEFLPEADDRPWERTGAERRDSEPDRGTLILAMGIGSILLSAFFFCPIAGLVGSVLGVILGLSAWNMGRNDLKKMDQHIMAREGRGSTHGGLVCGVIGLIVSMIAAVVAIIITVSYLLN